MRQISKEHGLATTSTANNQSRLTRGCQIQTRIKVRDHEMPPYIISQFLSTILREDALQPQGIFHFPSPIEQWSPFSGSRPPQNGQRIVGCCMFKRISKFQMPKASSVGACYVYMLLF